MLISVPLLRLQACRAADDPTTSTAEADLTVRTDRLGDVLPYQALLRMGTHPFQHSGGKLESVRPFLDTMSVGVRYTVCLLASLESNVADVALNAIRQQSRSARLKRIVNTYAR